jgi:hypothetical protein
MAHLHMAPEFRAPWLCALWLLGCVGTQVAPVVGDTEDSSDDGPNDESGTDSEIGTDTETDADTDTGTDTDTDTDDPEPPLWTEPLTGDTCDVEVVWSSKDYYLRDFAPGQPGEFFLAGRILVGEEAGQVTLRVADGELDWEEVFELSGSINGPGINRPDARRVLQRPDGNLWVFGHHQNVGESWVTAYSPAGELLWENRWQGIEWLDADDDGDTIYATASFYDVQYAIIHRLDALGETSWSFQIDDIWPSPWGVAVRGEDVWAVGAQPSLECAWRAHWTTDGQFQSSECVSDDSDDDGYSYRDILILANGSRVVGGSNRIHKPKDVGSIWYGEPLVALLDAAGIEQQRWTYGPDIYNGGEIRDMAELVDGGFVAVSQENDSAIDDDLDSPTILRFDQNAQYLARCQLDRIGTDDYWGTLERVEVGLDGEIYALLEEGKLGHFELGQYAILRIIGLGE